MSDDQSKDDLARDELGVTRPMIEYRQELREKREAAMLDAIIRIAIRIAHDARTKGKRTKYERDRYFALGAEEVAKRIVAAIEEMKGIR